MKVSLRKVKNADISILFEHQRDPEANEMVGFPAGDPNDRKAFTAKWNRILSDESIKKRVIIFKNKVVGNLTGFVAPWSGEREVGYWIAKEYWGLGIATEALNQFLKIEKTRPLHARVAGHNIGSRRVLEKCDFEKIGTEIVRLKDSGIEIEEITFRLN